MKDKEIMEMDDCHFLPGQKPVLELLKENPEKICRLIVKKNRHINKDREIFAIARKNGIPIMEKEAAYLERMVGKNISHQGVIAILGHGDITPFSALLQNAGGFPLLLALDQIQDPGNLGAISRTAYALGIGGLILPKHNSALPGAGAYRSSAGALEKLPMAHVVNLARSLDLAEEKGFQIYGSISAMDKPEGMTTSSAWDFVWELPAILVLGNENRGIRPGVMKRCMKFITIPFNRAFDSLNIAQAAAILMGLCARQYFSHADF